MSDSLGRTAQCRRLYHHMVHGGRLKLRDIEYLIETIEGKDLEIQVLEAENIQATMKADYIIDNLLHKLSYGN